MKKIFVVFVCMFSVYFSTANIHFINFEKIPNYQNYFTQIGLIIDYVDYFRINQGTLETPKNEGYFIEQFTLFFYEFKKLDTNNIETNFLLADIAFFLSELQVSSFKYWCKHYLDRSLNLGADSFRSYWFLGNYYNSFNKYSDAYNCYNLAYKFIKEINISPLEFWQEYSNLMFVIQAWAHLDYGLNVINHLGFDYLYEGSPQQNKLKLELQQLPVHSKINKQKIWAARKINNRIYFYSRSLGIQLLLDSNWSISFSDYANNNSMLTLYPTKFKNEDQKNIISSFSINFKTFSKYHQVGRLEHSTQQIYGTNIKYKKYYLLPEFLTTERINLNNNNKLIDIYSEIYSHDNNGMKVEIPIFPNENVFSGDFFSPQTNLKRLSPIIEYKISLEVKPENLDKALNYIKSFIQQKLIFE